MTGTLADALQAFLHRGRNALTMLMISISGWFHYERTEKDTK